MAVLLIRWTRHARASGERRVNGGPHRCLATTGLWPTYRCLKRTPTPHPGGASAAPQLAPRSRVCHSPSSVHRGCLPFCCCFRAGKSLRQCGTWLREGASPLGRSGRRGPLSAPRRDMLDGRARGQPVLVRRQRGHVAVAQLAQHRARLLRPGVPRRRSPQVRGTQRACTARLARLLSRRVQGARALGGKGAPAGRRMCRWRERGRTLTCQACSRRRRARTLRRGPSAPPPAAAGACRWAR